MVSLAADGVILCMYEKRHKMLIVNMVFFETRLRQMPTNWNKTKKTGREEVILWPVKYKLTFSFCWGKSLLTDY